MAKPAVRLGAVQIAFAVGVVAVVGRAAQVQLIDGASYRARAAAQRTKSIELPARRGAIYDRLGVTLARTQEIFHVEVAPRELQNLEENSQQIANHLGLRLKTLRSALAKGYAYFHGPFAAGQVQPLRSMQGVYLRSEQVRFYPDPGFAQPLLGWPAAAGRPASGIERSLDTLLAGIPGHAVVLKDGNGRRYESPARLDAFPVAGHDVYLTIDGGLQEIVEDALGEAIERYEAEGGDVVVLQPGTGEILAAVSRTSTGGRTSSAFTAVFEPGSTAKPFVVAALLMHGRANLDDSIWAENGTYDLAGRMIRDDHPSGWLSLADVIRRSSNVGIVKFAGLLEPREQYEMLRSFGLGAPTAVEYPSESAGLLKRPDRWSGLTAASLAMGYEVAVTPLQLAQAYAAIANDGLSMRPSLVRRITRPDGGVLYEHAPEPVRRVVPPPVAAKIRSILRGVVSAGGTGETAALTSYALAGKTGTAVRAGPQGYVRGEYTASFVSLFPADGPQMVMVVKLDSPKDAYATLTAAPLTRLLLERVLAAQTGALDWAPLSDAPMRVAETTTAGVRAVSYVVSWPRAPRRDSLSGRAVPELVGCSLREAARRLHGAGMRMSVVGWGRVQRTVPPAGTSVAPGTLVRVHAVTGGANEH